MAARPSKTSGSKPSFASIVAMAPPASNGRVTTVPENRESKHADHPCPGPTIKTVAIENTPTLQLHQELQSSMSKLAIKEVPSQLNKPSEQEVGNALRAGLRFDDDQSHVSSSSTKPTSLDGKSVTSGTTFAMDEKESLRPDDSASVKAADEEEFNSGPASAAPSSRVGSEAGSRAFRDQFYEISERIGPGSHRTNQNSRRGIPGIEEESPQGTLPPVLPTLPAPVSIPRPEVNLTNGAPFNFDYQEPDEKLFEALESPKDRLFLLRLEQDVITFVRDSMEPMIDLPPCNSFCRLLAHKLADYYALTHFVDNAVSSVRLYRTPYCRLPTPLSAISKLSASTDANPPFQPAMKIMRRAGIGKDGLPVEPGLDTTGSSIAPSKAGSEAGEDSQRGTGVASPTESISAKDKAAMTREEREAKYKETRERIFKDFGDPDNPDAALNMEIPTEVSRASSTNGRKKPKKAKNNDDGFQARSQFNAYYPEMQYPGTTYDQAASSMAFFNPYTQQQAGIMGQPGNMSSAMLQQNYVPGYQPVSNAPGSLMPMQQVQMLNGSQLYRQNSNPHSPLNFNQQFSTQYYQQPQQSVTLSQQTSAMSSPSSNNVQLSRPQSQQSQISDQWSQPNYPYPYQRPENQHPPYQSQAPSMPYQYGQLPYQPTIQSGRLQHPLPGSYSRQSFNPQTRSFVPANGLATGQSGPFVNRGNDSSMLNMNMAYQSGNQAYPYVQQPGNYNQATPMPIPGTYNAFYENKTNGTRKTSGQQTSSQSPGQSTLSKWGTPANLPPKPPPPEAPSMPEGQNALPVNFRTNMAMEPMSNRGQSIPNFQNGTYLLQGAGIR